MSGKLSQETEKKLQELYEEGLSVAEISRLTEIPVSTVRGHTKVLKEGFRSYSEYREHLAKQKGFASLSEYQEHLANSRQEKLENKVFGAYMKSRLEDTGKTQAWLADELEITEGAVSRYASGRTIPRKKLQKRVFEALDSKYKSIDELLTDYHRGNLRLLI